MNRSHLRQTSPETMVSMRAFAIGVPPGDLGVVR